MLDFLFSDDQRGRQHMTRRQHYRLDLALGRAPFGRGVSPRRTVLLVPEARKRRSERDPEKLREQMDRAAGLTRK